jgi:hypothetical protein
MLNAKLVYHRVVNLNMRSRLFFLVVFQSILLSASKVTTVGDSDWNNPATWINDQVPVNPDTIIIKHYVTFNASLSIIAPTVLIIDKQGTLCGDHFLDVECGAKLINYGHLYINSGLVRDGENHNYLSAKSMITIVGCALPGHGKGYSNIPPGITEVWPPVLCKTAETNWSREITGVEHRQMKHFLLSQVHNSPRMVLIQTHKYAEIIITDVAGRLIMKIFSFRECKIDLSASAPGLYFVVANTADHVYQGKIILH